MYPPQKLILLERVQTDDGIGGKIESWVHSSDVKGYIDLINGTDQNSAQNAFIEDSTHVAIIPEYRPGIDDAMRLEDENGRWYFITYVDDPVGVHHHLELFLKWGGDDLGEEREL